MALVQDGVPKALRHAMRRFAATVSIVTVRQGGRSYGVSATAVTSVSLAPPSLLAILSSKASALEPLLESRRFCVNFLKAEQEDLSRVFASKQFAGRRFEYGNWTESDGYVYLSDAQANVFCELRESIAFGTHVLCLGQAERVQFAGPVNPLIYLNGRYFSAPEYIGSGA